MLPKNIENIYVCVTYVYSVWCATEDDANDEYPFSSAFDESSAFIRWTERLVVMCR